MLSMNLPVRVPLRILDSVSSVLLAIAWALAAPVADAQERAATLPPVTISAKRVREPVEKSYRRMVRGMDLFEQRRALAPEAPLRFKLLPRHADTDMRDIQLDVVGKTVEISIPVAPDNSFVLPRDRKALDEDALVVPDRKAGTMTWRTEIRTPGLPPQTRRLGDLRLECEVGMEARLVSNQRGLIDRIIGAFTQTPDYCGGLKPRYLFFADQPVFGVTLVSGQRREVLPVSQLYAGASEDPAYRDDLPYCDCEVLLDRSYFLPLGDRSWPDDTLVEFEAIANAPSAVDYVPSIGGIVPGRSTRADVVGAFPKAVAIRFDSGYEAWVDRPRPETRDRKEIDVPERIFLVDPSGGVTKARLRLPVASRAAGGADPGK